MTPTCSTPLRALSCLRRTFHVRKSLESFVEIYDNLGLGPVIKRLDLSDWEVWGKHVGTDFGTVRPTENGLVCHDPLTARERWLSEEASGKFSYFATGQNVIVPSETDPACVIAISADTGSVNWRYRPSPGGWAYPVALSKETVYVLERTHPTLHALDVISGDVQWTLPLHENIDLCVDATMRDRQLRYFSRDHDAIIIGDRLIVITAHAVCMVQLP